MGEAKRRKQHDPNWKKPLAGSNEITEQNFIKELDVAIKRYRKAKLDKTPYIYHFTNNDNGVSFESIHLLRESLVNYWDCEIYAGRANYSGRIVITTELKYISTEGLFCGWCIIGFIKNGFVKLPKVVDIVKGDLFGYTEYLIELIDEM